MQVVESHGARIPAIGLGTMTLTGNACVETVAAALQLGYRHLDTAAFYGNEREVGEGLRAFGGCARGGIPHHQGAPHRSQSRRFRALGGK